MFSSFALTSWSAPREVNPTFRTTPPGLQFLRKLGPNFQNTGLEIEPRFPAKPIRRKSVPNLGRSWGESSLQPFGCKLVRLQLGQIQVASTAIHLHLLHGHRPRSRSLDFGFWISDFGFWISDFGLWILDFGFRISDSGFWISLVFVLFVAAPNGPVWISDFGFWISDFGFWISDFGFWILDLGFIDAVWILHKIFPNHADSGRRIYIYIYVVGIHIFQPHSNQKEFQIIYHDSNNQLYHDTNSAGRLTQ